MAVVIVVLIAIIIFMSALSIVKCLTNKVSKETQMMYEESITGYPQASNPSYKGGGSPIVSDPYITTKKCDVN